MSRTPVTGIPNGCDAADFAGPAHGADGASRIVHAGSPHTDPGRRRRYLKRARQLLGGKTPVVDLHTCSYVYVFEAIEQLVRKRAETRRSRRAAPRRPARAVDKSVVGSSPLVRGHGSLSHRKTRGVMRSADLVFLAMHDVPPGRRVAIVPCKT